MDDYTLYYSIFTGYLVSAQKVFFTGFYLVQLYLLLGELVWRISRYIVRFFQFQLTTVTVEGPL